jgi:hypothetical protein
VPIIDCVAFPPYNSSMDVTRIFFRITVDADDAESVLDDIKDFLKRGPVRKRVESGCDAVV